METLAALLDAGPLLDALCETADFGVTIVDRDLRVLKISRMLASTTPLPPDALVGRPFREVAPSVFPLLEESLERVFVTGNPVFDLEHSVAHLGGVLHFVHQLVPRRHEGVVAAVAILMSDRTKERSTEHALRKSEAQFRAICETAPIGIFLTDANGSSVYTNHVNARQMGIPLEQTFGSGWERALHPGDRESVRQAFYAATLERRGYRGVNRYLHGDGRVVFVEVKAEGVYDGEALLGYVGVAEDITGRLQAEATLRESEMRFRELAENIDAAFWLSSADHHEVYYVSPAFERIWGRPPTLRTDFPGFLSTVYADDRHIVLGATAHLERGFSIEYRITRPDGSIRWISDKGFPIRDERGVVVRQAGIATDITTRKVLEAQLLQSQKLDSIGRLAGGIAHDFNNLLAVIQGQTAAVARSLEEGELRSRLHEVEAAAKRATDLTRHLLTFARRQAVQPAILDLNDIVTGVEPLLRRMIGPDVQVVLRLDPDLAIVRADPTQVEQVMVNLVVNAREAMPAGGTLTIATSNRDLDERTAVTLGVLAGAYVELSVSDTGPGIPEEILPQLFDPFFTTREAAGGIGLGLSTCYGIVRQSGGAIAVESAAGRGATFRTVFPRIELA